MRLATIGVFFVVIFGASAGSATGRYEGGDHKMLDGTWQLVEAELGGMKLPQTPGKTLKLILKGAHYELVGAESPDEGTVKLFTDKSPKAMEIVGQKGPNKGKTFPAIYELKDDMLTVCYNLGGAELPKEFATKKGTQLFLAKYRKEK